MFSFHTCIVISDFQSLITPWLIQSGPLKIRPMTDFGQHPSQRSLHAALLWCHEAITRMNIFFFFMFNTGVTYCLREQLSWGRKAEPSTDSFTEEEAWLGSENKALSWLSEPKLQIWLWPWAGHLTCSENRKIKVKNLQVNKNVENSLPILLFLCTVRYSMV